MMKEFVFKLHSKMHRLLVVSQRERKYYFWLYKSYWHMLFSSSKKTSDNKFLSARPNPGAGIGHQISNWISGYTLAKSWNIKYACIPFSYINNPFVANTWNELLGFSDGEVKIDSLIRSGYKVVLLPLFDENNEKEITVIKKIIDSYQGRKIFLLEQDQKIANDTLCMDDLNKKYRKGHKPSPLYDKKIINIAIHVRRGDIVQTGKKRNDNLTMRWLDDGYYIKIIDILIELLKSHNYKIYLFSQGKDSDFACFLKYEKLKLCLDISAQETFKLLTDADVLVMSKSGFSYQAAKLNQNGLLIYPYGFWHNVFDASRTVVPDENGNIDILKMQKMLEGKYEERSHTVDCAKKV